MRVYRLCCFIGEKEDADIKVLKIASLLHDIGRNFEQPSEDTCHAEKSLLICKDFINNLYLPQNSKDNIAHCIKSHRFRGKNPPETLEAKVLFDSDKLDAIGAVGIARAYMFAGEIGAMLHNPDHDILNTRPYTKQDTGYREYKTKLCMVKDSMMTETGRAIAKKRHEFMDIFFKRFIEEYEGTK